MWRRCGWIAAWSVIAALALMGAAPAAPAAEPRLAQNAAWTIVREHWYVIELDGHKAGWRHDLVETDGSTIRSSGEQAMSFSRAGQEVQIQMSSVFEETRDGEPLRVTSKQKLARQETEQEWVFTPQGIQQTDNAGGQRQTKQIPLPTGEWLTPGEVERFIRQRLAAGASKMEYRTMMPEAGVEVINVTSTRADAGETEVNGRKVPVIVWETTSSLMPIVSRQSLSADGVMLREEVDAGFGKMTLRHASKDQALAQLQEPAPDVFANMFTKANRPIPNVMASRRIEYRLKTMKGPMPELPVAGAQAAVRSAEGQPTHVAVDLDHRDAVELTDQQRQECVEANLIVDAKDSLIRKLTDRTIRQAGDAAEAREKAEALREFVHRHIALKGFDTAFASASETARTQTGDCSEHAVLLCAMLRAAGIPSRTASGLLYLDHFGNQSAVFGWHMWTQAYVDGAWMDLDATLNRTYHAGHILTSVSTMSERGINQDMASVVSLVGNLEIEVVKIDGETRP